MQCLLLGECADKVFGLGVAALLVGMLSPQLALYLMFSVVVLTALTVPLNNFLLNTVLKEGALDWLGQPEIDLTFLGLMIYIATIAAVVQILEMVLDKFVPALYNTLGIFLPLLTVNCAILGASLFMVERDYTFLESTAYGIGAGGGFMMAVILLAAIREKSEYADSPKGLRGLGMTFISAGLMAMAFMGFAGISF